MYLLSDPFEHDDDVLNGFENRAKEIFDDGEQLTNDMNDLTKQIIHEIRKISATIQIDDKESYQKKNNLEVTTKEEWEALDRSVEEWEMKYKKPHWIDNIDKEVQEK